MADNVHTTTDGSMTSLVGGIVDDAQNLIRQQFTLLKAEVQQDMRKTSEATVSLVVGLGVCLIGLIVLSFMLVYWLNAAVPDVPFWVWFGIVGGVITAIGAGLAVYGVQKFRSFNPLPDETAKALEENLAWTMNRK
ncbi:MAG: phage holin family protein [Gemmataceae bacterium]